MSRVAVLALLALAAAGAASAQDVDAASVEALTGFSAASAQAIADADPAFSFANGIMVAACAGAEGHEHAHDDAAAIGVANAAVSPDASDPLIAQALSLQSRPSAKAKIFLNFHGGT